MTAKEYVKLTFPYARAEKYTNGRIKGMQTSFYLIWSSPQKDKIRLAEGKTESVAWSNAKRYINEPTIPMDLETSGLTKIK